MSKVTILTSKVEGLSPLDEVTVLMEKQFESHVALLASYNESSFWIRAESYDELYSMVSTQTSIVEAKLSDLKIAADKMADKAIEKGSKQDKEKLSGKFLKGMTNVIKDKGGEIEENRGFKEKDKNTSFDYKISTIASKKFNDNCSEKVTSVLPTSLSRVDKNEAQSEKFLFKKGDVVAYHGRDVTVTYVDKKGGGYIVYEPTVDIEVSVEAEELHEQNESVNSDMKDVKTKIKEVCSITFVAKVRSKDEVKIVFEEDVPEEKQVDILQSIEKIGQGSFNTSRDLVVTYHKVESFNSVEEVIEFLKDNGYQLTKED